eukprot:6212136-Pleurochrysis_carterae.AAC.5
MSGKRSIEAIVFMVKCIESDESVLAQPVLKVSLHHGFNSHSGGSWGVVRVLDNDSNQITSAIIALVAIELTCREAVHGTKDRFHQLAIYIR